MIDVLVLQFGKYKAILGLLILLSRDLRGRTCKSMAPVLSQWETPLDGLSLEY